MLFHCGGVRVRLSQSARTEFIRKGANAAQNGCLGSSFWPLANPALIFARTWRELLPIVADDPSSRNQHRAHYLTRNRWRRPQTKIKAISILHCSIID